MNLQSYFEDKLSTIMIYHNFAYFEKSSVSCISDKRLPLVRLILGIMVTLAFIDLILFDPYDGKIWIRLMCDLELYAGFFAILAIILAHRASAVTGDTQINSVGELKKKKRALIINEIAISLNFAVFLLYFVFLPIVYGYEAF